MYYTDKSLNTEKNRTIFKIVEKMFPNKRFFIVGSSLYKKDFNDIDVLVLGKRKNIKKNGIFHIIEINEKNINNIIYQTMIQKAISNTKIKKYKTKNITIENYNFYDYFDLLFLSLSDIKTKYFKGDIKILFNNWYYYKYNKTPSINELNEFVYNLNEKKIINSIIEILRNKYSSKYRKYKIKNIEKEYYGVKLNKKMKKIINEIQNNM